MNIGKVLADWYTGDFEVLEMERVDRRLLLRPEDAPPLRVVKRKFRVEKGRVNEEPSDPRQHNAGSGPSLDESPASDTPSSLGPRN